MVDPLISSGAGRSPQYAGNIEEFLLDDDLITPMSSTGVTVTKQVTSARKSFAMLLAAKNNDFSSGTLPASTLFIRLNENVMAQYALPRDWSSTNRWNINEVIPVIKELWGAGNRFSAQVEFDSGVQAQCIIKLKLTLMTLPI